MSDGAARRPPRAARRSPESSKPDARRAATVAFEQTLATLAPAELALERAERGLDERDRRLARELLFGALRWKRRLEAIVESASERRLEAIDEPLRAPLLVAAVQLLLLERVPAHAAVSEAVEEARRRSGSGAAGFANAVLRRIAARPRFDDWPIAESEPIRRLALETSHPDRLVERWWQRWGEERTRRLLDSSNGERPLHLLTFRDRGGRDAAARALAEEGCQTQPSAIAPGGLVVTGGNPLRTDCFRRGEIYIQDEASQAAALIPPPHAGERVYDAAAAPGGKGLSLVACEPGVALVSADRSLRRLSRLRANLVRLGRETTVIAAEAERPPALSAFDRVVLDAPCSGTGTLRRHPELRWRFREEELVRLAGEALHQLAGVADLVAPDGLLVHVTCSIEPEENEELIARFLDARRDFALEPLVAEELPAPGVALVESGRWRLLPEGGHDGFSVAVLRRSR